MGDKFLNHLISSVRIIVEHVIAGVKRCRIVKDVLRLTKTGISDMVMEMACGLHNLRVSCRHPLPTFDVLRRFLEKILPYGTRPDYTFAFLTSNPFVRYSGVRACSTPAMSSVPHARTENRYTLSGLENDWSHTALL